jgi:ribosome maturation factor RimP
MAHPLIPAILELAQPIAASLQLDVVTAVFQTNQSPPILRLDIRSVEGDTGLEDCERMSRLFEEALDASGIIPDAYMLEVSSPGVPDRLTTDREFNSFKGFPIAVHYTDPELGPKEHLGHLVRRDDTYVHLNKKGRIVKVPRDHIQQVQLLDGDPT